MPTPRKPWRQRLRERGLKWSVELVVGIFVAVVAVSLATVVLGRPGGVASITLPTGNSAAAAPAAPTPACAAAPIAGSTLRPCTH